MSSPLSPTGTPYRTATDTTDRTVSESSLGFTPYSGDSRSLSTDGAPTRTAAQYGNLRYQAPKHSLGVDRRDSPIDSGRSGVSSALSSSPFLPLVSGAGEPVSSSYPVSWDPATRIYSLVPKATPATKEDLTGGEVRAAARVESAVPDRASAAAASVLFPAKAPRRLSGPILLAPLGRPVAQMPRLHEEKPS
ncbi:MAG: hypothetical protein NTX49_00380 [Chlamydiae bacterium]|nr:hypothetical protein [Chlamydiota bacterium]